jgi:hypothetical protein
VNGIALGFGTALDPFAAQLAGLYSLVVSSKDSHHHRKTRGVRILGAEYNPMSQTVTLMLDKLQSGETQGTLTVRGLVDVNGQLLWAAPLSLSVDLRPAGHHG